MEVLLIEPTKSTPRIEFNPENSFFEIKGISKPEDVRSFYYPILEWLEFLEEELVSGNIDLEKINLNFKLHYFNSSSAKFLLDIVAKFNDFKIPVLINWYYEEEDLDLLEAGKDMAEMVDFTFNYISVENF